MVSAPVMRGTRDQGLTRCAQDKTGVYDGYIKLTVTTERQERSVAGTVFSDGKPRFIQIKGINMDAELGQHMLYVTNEDKPGFIGDLGSVLGDAGVNIATFNLLLRGGDVYSDRQAVTARSTARVPGVPFSSVRMARLRFS
jgi:D-3-phosphoglycerate dehydrogenase